MEQRKNIWINKGNLDLFNQEPNKSGLVNDLLMQHYSPAKVSRDITEPKEVRSKVAPAVKEIKGKDFGALQKKGKK